MSLSELMQQLKNGNKDRRRQHPDWPSHRVETYIPGKGMVITNETVPIHRMDGAKGYCKYCHSHHKNWWMMDQRDYMVRDHTIILCGECEYTVSAEYAGIQKKFLNPWKFTE